MVKKTKKISQGNPKAIERLRYAKQGKQWALIERTYLPEFMPDGETKTWDNIMGTRRFFRGLGGTELTKGDTHTSTNPDKTQRTVYIKKI